MLRRLKLMVPLLLGLFLLAANFGVFTAHAHPWGSYHWNKGGAAIYIYQYNTASRFAEAERARANAWNTIGILYNYAVNYHTDVSVFDGNFGATGWAGLASLESLSWDWGCWCYDHISHGHARYNAYYGGSSDYIQGVFCQEDFHTYGFLHDNTGGCMGLGYYYGQTIYLNAHNNTDFYNRYRTH